MNITPFKLTMNVHTKANLLWTFFSGKVTSIVFAKKMRLEKKNVYGKFIFIHILWVLADVVKLH